MNQTQWQRMMISQHKEQAVLALSKLLEKNITINLRSDGILVINRLNIDENCMYVTPIAEFNTNLVTDTDHFNPEENEPYFHVCECGECDWCQHRVDT